MGGNLHAERLEGGWKHLLQGEPEPFKRIRSDLQTLLPEAGTKTPSQRGSRAPSSSQTRARNRLQFETASPPFTGCLRSVLYRLSNLHPHQETQHWESPPPAFIPRFSLITDTARTTKRNRKDGLRGGITAKSVFKCQ